MYKYKNIKLTGFLFIIFFFDKVILLVFGKTSITNQTKQY